MTPTMWGWTLLVSIGLNSIFKFDVVQGPFLMAVILRYACTKTNNDDDDNALAEEVLDSSLSPLLSSSSSNNQLLNNEHQSQERQEGEIISEDSIDSSIKLRNNRNVQECCDSSPLLLQVEEGGGQMGHEEQTDNANVLESSSNGSAATSTSSPSHNFDAHVVVVASQPQPTTVMMRKHFLDNIKIFLTATVVVHHVTCAFGGCGNSWFLVIAGDGGDGVDNNNNNTTTYPKWFVYFTNIFMELNQSYFMCLFFFISAHFIPQSIIMERHRRGNFFATKRKRLLYPLLFCFYILNPITIVIAKLTWWKKEEEKTTKYHTFYIPNAGHCWYILWLLLFCWIYYDVHVSWFQQRGSENEATNYELQEVVPPIVIIRRLPCTWQRWFCGVVICGLLMFSMFLGTWGTTIIGMPIWTGSLPCDLVMFCMGILAHQNKWLDRPLRQQMDITPKVLYSFVLLEMIGIGYMSVLLHDNTDPTKLLPILLGLFVISGVYCLDMCLAILVLFQEYMNFCNKFTNFLASGAYGVYLLHPIVIVSLSHVYIYTVYRIVPSFDGSHNNFQEFVTKGGDVYAPLGWLIMSMMALSITWIMAYSLKQIPCLNSTL